MPVKRNWLGELVSAGHSKAEIMRESGLSRSVVNRLVNGGKPSSRSQWNLVYNTARRVAYRDLSQNTTLTEREVKRVASHAYRPDKSTSLGRRIVERPLFQDTYQLRIVGLFEDEKTRKRATSEGWSKTHADIDRKAIDEDIAAIQAGLSDESEDDYDSEGYGSFDDVSEPLSEAIHHAQSKLGGSNWHLIRVLDVQIVKWEMRPPKLGG